MTLKFSLFITCIFLSFQSYALRISYHAGNAPPYAMTINSELVNGVIRDIGEELGRILKVNIDFHFTSRARCEDEIAAGKSDLYIIYTPKWAKNKSKVLWSIPLFEENDIIVTHRRNPIQVNTKSDLYGKRLGTLYRYIYSDLTDDFKSGQIIRDDTNRLEQNFERLEKGMIDAFIGSDLLVKYYIKKSGRYGDFIINKYIESTHQVQTILSSKSEISLEQLNSAYREMIKSGTIKKILEKYR